MGEARKDALRVKFDNKLRLEFHGARITSDAGLLAYRELDEALGLTTLAEGRLAEVRTGRNTRHSLTALFRQSVFSRLAGYEDTNDAERLCVDPAMRHVVGGRAKEATAVSASQMSRFETKLLTRPNNLQALMAMPGQWVDRVRQRKAFKKLVLAKGSRYLICSLGSWMPIHQRSVHVDPQRSWNHGEHEPRQKRFQVPYLLPLLICLRSRGVRVRNPTQRQCRIDETHWALTDASCG